MNSDKESSIGKKDILIIVGLEYAKQVMLKTFVHHLLIHAQAVPEQWPLASFPPVYILRIYCYSQSKTWPCSTTGKKSNFIPA